MNNGRDVFVQGVCITRKVMDQQDCNFSTIVREIKALMVSGWNGLNEMDPWMTKEDVIGEIKV